MTRLPELTRERLKEYLAVLDYEGAAGLAEETYPVERKRHPPAERTEMFDQIVCHAMEQADQGRLDAKTVQTLIEAHGHELSTDVLGDIAVDPEWSVLLEQPPLAD